MGAALLLLAVTLLTAVPAFAQTGNSVLIGRVTDASTKAPAADVVVTATSPALQGEQMVVTDGTGQYRIPNLPPGDYTLRLEKESYKPYSRGGIAIRSGTTIRVNVELLPEALKAEEIVVVGRAPTVDVGSSSVGQSITSDFTRRVPVAPPGGKGTASRSFESVAAVTPGAKSDEFGTSIAGTSSPENQYVIDGLSVNDPAYGIIGTPLTMEFIKEVNVVSGGYMPEFGRATGGVLDVVTKSGGNEFHGSVFFNLTPGLFEGAIKPVRRQGETIQTDDRLSSIRDYGFEVGGPILKDKLWFYGGVDIAFRSVELERNLYATRYDAQGNPIVGADGFNEIVHLPGSQRFDRGEEQTLQYLGKLTYQFSPDHSVALSVYGSPSSSGGNGAYGFDPQQGTLELTNLIGEYGALAHEYIASSTDVALKWSSAFNNKTLLFDATLGWHGQRNASLPPDGSELGSREGLAGVPLVVWQRTRRGARPGWRHSIEEFETLTPEARALCEQRDVEVDGQLRRVVPCAVRSYWQGGPNFTEDASQNRFQLKAMVTSIFEGLGHHVVKGGIDAELMLYRHEKAYPGLASLSEGPDGTFFLDSRELGFLTGPDIDDAVPQAKTAVSSLSTTIGGFVQDSWSILDKVTLNVGVRYDAQYLFDDGGKMGMALPNQWSPRVGVVYDFTQQGKSKVFANYARYYESVPLDLVDRAFGDERQVRSFHRSTLEDTDGVGCNPTNVEETLYGDPANGVPPGRCQTDENRIAGTERAAGFNYAPASYDPNQYWTPTGGGKTPVDPDISPQSSDEIVLGGEYEIIPNGRVGATYTKRWMHNVIEDMSRDEGSTYFIGNPGKGIAKDFPEPTRDYDALTLYFQKSFEDLWLAQVSYTLSYLRGNYAGLFRPETDQLDPNITSEFDLTSLLDNREGDLPGDRRHELKIMGAKSFEIPNGDLADVGLSLRSRSGGPTDFWGAHPLYGNDEAFILPRGSGERLPWVHNVDGHLGYSMRLAKDSYLTISMDVFNIFNFQAPTVRDQRYTTSAVDVRGCRNGTVEDLEPASGDSCLKTLEGTPFDKADKNPNFGKPTQYQAPRQFRFGARVTF